jgi:hypothetical protein
MRVLRLAPVRSSAAIGAAAVLLAVGLLATPAATAAPTTTATLATTVTPASETKISYRTWVYFAFTGVVTNNGPDAASLAVVTVHAATVAFSAPSGTGCSQSGNTYTCAALPAGASITAAVTFKEFLLGHVNGGVVTVTGSDATNTSSANFAWAIVCWYRGNCI